MTSTKSYSIAKRTVWDAYQKVKTNCGAAGIDDETIAMYEQNLSKNLYKLWNRMSSRSYIPPPVKQVEIPRASGGFRKLGIPTVSDRVAQTVAKLIIEPILDPMFHPDSYGFIRIPAGEIGETGGCHHQRTVPETSMGGRV